MLGKKPDELLRLQDNELTPIFRNLSAITEKVQQDIDKRRISEADGQKLILKATIVVNMLTKR